MLINASWRGICTLGALGLAGTAWGQCAALSFAPAAVYPVQSTPVSIGAGDVNSDGLIDLVSANRIAGGVTILPGVPGPTGQATGTFSQGWSQWMGTQPHWVALADLNIDGATDLITANASTGTVGVALWDGDQFPGAVQYAAGAGARCVAVGDFNEDGLPDLAVARVSANVIQLMLNEGAGAFGTGPVVTGFSGPEVVVAADIDRDGHLDLIVSNHASNTVAVRRGDGAANFFVQSTMQVGSQPMGVAVTDLDGDGLMDLAVANQSSASFSVLYGLASGGFTPAATISAGSNPFGIAAADFDGDGRKDLVITNQGEPTVLVVQGLPGRTWATPLILATGAAPSGVVTADLNSDGRPDFAITCANAGRVDVFLNNGQTAAAIAVQPSSQIAAIGMPAQISVGTTGMGVQYQWRKGGIPITEGPGISGSTTATLNFASVSAAQDGVYDVIVGNACGSVTSRSVYIAVKNACGSADFNGDGDFGTDADIEAFFRVLAGGGC